LIIIVALETGCPHVDGQFFLRGVAWSGFANAGKSENARGWLSRYVAIHPKIGASALMGSLGGRYVCTMENIFTMQHQKITPFLWFDNNAEDAMNFYTSIFKNSKVLGVSRYGEAGPGQRGQVMTATFQIGGMKFTALNAGPRFKFTEAISFVIDCETQEEVDYFWNKLTSDGGQESMCGWVKDKFGLSWQIVPTTLGQLFSGGDSGRTNRVMQAMLQMKKLDIKKLQEAYDHM
jgi:predicted 3-demethylubiquinone-9 3-methyltransferase (glyoxalase superfamily)